MARFSSPWIIEIGSILKQETRFSRSSVHCLTETLEYHEH
jgi:hypothetical protein